MAMITVRLRPLEVHLPVRCDGEVLLWRQNNQVIGIEAVLDGTKVMDLLANWEFHSFKLLEEESMRLPVFALRLEAAVALLEAVAHPQPA
jgi:hypothetical protein